MPVLTYQRYCSDRTVTINFDDNINISNRNQIFQNNLTQKIYDIVLKAQLETISKIKVGMKACEIDKKLQEIL